MTQTSVDFSQKIVLGTAQFGMDYGIANVSGKPSKSEVFEILEMAWRYGIRSFDTAPGYESESLLGEFIAVHGLEKDAILLTKLPGMEETEDKQSAIRANIEASLEKLGCSIEVLFFHNPQDSVLLLKDPSFFKKLLEEYPLKNLGVSVYDPPEVELLKDCKLELAFQFPFNVLDRRFEKVNMPHGRRYARSIFLQGLLASAKGLRSNAPKEQKHTHNLYHRALKKHGLKPVDAAVSFVVYSDCVDYFLMGVETEKQLQDVLITSLDQRPSITYFETLLSSIDETLIDPRKWN